jgi:PAS domain S-box-containing protein
LLAATSARRRAEQALHESERRYRELVEHSLGLICIHDLSGIVLSVNPAAAESLGYEPADAGGHDLREWLAPSIRHLFDEYLTRIRSLGRDEGLMRLVARDGTTRTWMYRNILHEEPGAEPYVLGHAIDISERFRAEKALKASQQALERANAELERRVLERTAELQSTNARLEAEIAERRRAEESRERALEAAREANRLKEEFLSTLSHELRTPLNAILGWARILRRFELDSTVAHAVEVIDRNVEAQTRLIDEILDVSRIIAGKLKLQFEPLDLAATVRAAIEAMRPPAEAKGIVIEAELDAGAPAVLGDALRIQQVVTNLLSNAIKFTESGGVITVTMSHEPDNVRLRVADTGIGIRPEILPFVFDRFRQADSSTTRRHGGLGLGLAIVRHLVDLHGGTVWAESEGEGQGAAFIVRLPITSAANWPIPAGEPPAPRVPVPTTPTSRLDGRTVLVVDDDADARDVVATVFNDARARVVVAGSCREALDGFARQLPDVLIADVGMPDEDGFTLIRRVRDRSAEQGGRVLAIALTAYARPEDRDRALEAGFDRHVVKPVDPHELVAVVTGMIA